MHKTLIYTDGGARGNPGPGAIGILVFDENEKLLLEHKEKIGITTNNQAEYNALIKAMESARKLKAEEVVCTTDSELMYNQLTGNYKVRDSKLKELFEKAKELEKEFQKISYRHVLRNHPKIQRADELVNEALDNK